MNSLYSLAEIRAIERTATGSLPPGTLMRRAGQAAADLAVKLFLSSLAADQRRVLVLAGPGNNGGDALEAAAALCSAGIRVSLLSFAEHAKQSQDARQAQERAQQSGVHFLDSSYASALTALAEPWPLVIDGLFGIGLARPITGMLHDLIERLNGLDRPVLALDIPSGLDADTGTMVGAAQSAGIAVRASHTITFIADKPGLHTAAGRDHAGEVSVAALDIPAQLFPAPHAQLGSVSLFAQALRRRRHDTHKGSYGDVAIVGGAGGMCGAPILAARAAAHSGAGRVFVAFADASSAPAYDSASPELMCRPAQSFDFSRATLVVGPGLGTSRAAADLLVQALNARVPLVLDADALNLLALEPALQNKLKQRSPSSLMTPHPLEAARLLASTSASVQSDRTAAARELARRYNATVVLKGSGSVIARPDGLIVINPTGNPALATAGSGDVLSGMCGALLAQGWPLWETALAAVWLHGAAADVLVQRKVGPIGLSAGEIVPAMRELLNRLVAEHAPR